jgi:sulfonate transport system substrate-binding protein
LVSNREFFLATNQFAKKNPQVLDVIFKELEKTDKWVQENPKEAAKFLAPQIGMSVATLDLTLGRRTFGLEKVSDQTAKDQQQIADTFYKLKLIPEDIEIQEALLKTNN